MRIHFPVTYPDVHCDKTKLCVISNEAKAVCLEVYHSKTISIYGLWDMLQVWHSICSLHKIIVKDYSYYCLVFFWPLPSNTDFMSGTARHEDLYELNRFLTLIGWCCASLIMRGWRTVAIGQDYSSLPERLSLWSRSLEKKLTVWHGNRLVLSNRCYSV